MPDKFKKQKIHVVRKDISILNQEKSFEGFKLVQISDLHINKWNIDLVEETLCLVNSIKPDLITITGDVICSGEKDIFPI